MLTVLDLQLCCVRINRLLQCNGSLTSDEMEPGTTDSEKHRFIIDKTSNEETPPTWVSRYLILIG